MQYGPDTRFVASLMTLAAERVSPEDAERGVMVAFRSDAWQMERAGFTLAHAREYFLCFEELNSPLSEGAALSRMEQLDRLYGRI